MASQDNVEDGMCSVYSAQPSETVCSMREVLSKEMNANAVNDFGDALPNMETLSQYTAPNSEVLVSMSDVFVPARLFDPTEYSIPNSEVDVSMKDAMSPIMKNEDVSVYSMLPSEVNVTMNGKSPVLGEFDTLSQYTVPKSELNVSMSDGFTPCKVMEKLQLDNSLAQVEEHTAVEDMWESAITAKASEFDESTFEYVQDQLGIPEERIFGLVKSDGSTVKVIDSVECLNRLNEFQPLPVDKDDAKFEMKTVFNKNMEHVSAQSIKSVESYLLKTSDASSVHHEI